MKDKDLAEDDYESARNGWIAPGKGSPGELTEAEEAQLGFGSRQRPEQEAAEARLREWVRLRFQLSADAAVLVSEIACRLPGCPPLETAVAFWEGDKRYHFKLFKPVTEVVIDDLPFAWMKAELLVPDGFNCDCC